MHKIKILKRLQDWLGDQTIRPLGSRVGQLALRAQLIVMRVRGVDHVWD